MDKILASEKRSSSLRTRVVHAGTWTVLAHFGALVLRFIGSLVMTRIYSPEVFGILSLVTAVQVMINLLTDIGLHQAIIQSHRGKEQKFLETAWTLQILRGMLIWFVGSLFALGLFILTSRGIIPPGSVYTYPQLPLYLTAALFSAVVLGFQSMRWVVASRELALKRILVIEFLTGAGSLAIVILAGWVTRSIWAYIFGMIVSAAITVVLSHALLPGNADRVGWDRSAFAELSHFGRWTFLSSTLSAFAINGDRLLLGSLVDAQVLGQYSVAYSLASVPDGIANRIFGSVAFPALSESFRKEPQNLSSVYFKIRGVTDSSILLIAGLLFSIGPELVRGLYDARYEPSGWMLQCISIGLIFSRYAISQNAYLALGKPEYMTPISLIKLVSLFGIAPLLYMKFGIPGAIIGISIHMLPATVFMIWLNGKHKLSNWAFEIRVLIMWGVGWFLGRGLWKAYGWVSYLVAAHWLGK